MAPYKALFEPLEIRGKEVRNRLSSSGHVPGYTPEGVPNERYIAYNREKGKGGIGLITFGGSTNIARVSTTIFGGLNVRSNDDVPPYRRLAQAVHGEGARIMCQIPHMGRHCRTDFAEMLPVAGPSQLREPGGARALPRTMDEEDIAAAIEDYVTGARRLAEAGLDGVEIISSMHLPGQFLSPLANQRSDRWGGTLENRLRFLRLVLYACRAALPSDFWVGVRYTADETNEGGIAPEEGIEVGRLLGAHGVADFLNVNGAYSGTQQGVNASFPGMEAKSAPHIALAREVRRVSGLVTMQASRLDTLSAAHWAVESGAMDLAGMTRPHIADPHIVAKLMRGEEHRIRPCVGAGYCLDRPYRGLDALCLHNPSTSRETTLPHDIEKAPTPQRAIVVGGGPTGDVLVYDEVGGHAALSIAQLLAEGGARVTFATMDPIPGRDLGAQHKPVYMRALRQRGARIAPDTRLLAITPSGNRLAATLEDRWSWERVETDFDAVVVDLGVVPDPSLFEALSPEPANRGRLDLHALADGRAQPVVPGLDAPSSIASGTR
ncbi:MAG: FAD-dependent oxidoreductase [Pseudomonadota bacterium]